MTDQNLTCRDCHQDFVHSAAEQSEYQGLGFNPPRRCPGCRQKKREQKALGLNALPRHGTVKYFLADRGYGFIVPDGPEGAPEVYVNFQQILDQCGQRRTLVIGQRVEFLTVPGREGKPAAANVRVLEANVGQ